MSFNCTGFVSIRNTEDGTTFVQNACNVLDEFWDTKDVLAMSTVVNIDMIYFLYNKSKLGSVCYHDLALKLVEMFEEPFSG